MSDSSAGVTEISASEVDFDYNGSNIKQYFFFFFFFFLKIYLTHW